MTLGDGVPIAVLSHCGLRRKKAGMIYFDIHDRARLPGRFYGESLSVTARA
ncbi:MAG: hypothetical protein Q4G24_15420 [Paracoccus sp. (in: a-proteobacteria)]|uniref:hypothetical protein n=1 Tax=Paracoccus sp. TaxID=267 RepID=UPI0026E063E1|nr:hypothetical protein [Paracoccus sp. (in: a-proteobacteria)]MDO5622837.1 hypothetical protein [Paracoccus sp. (in: a-proteobacteria)]